MQYYPSPFVSTRVSANATAFYDLFTGNQMVLRGPAGPALASVLKDPGGVDAYVSEFPGEAGQAVSLAMLLAEPPPGPYLRSMISSLDVEPAGSCNAVCAMCPRGAMTRPKSVMSEATFDALCRQLGGTFPGSVRQVLFCGFGEPLQNPRLAEMARQIRRVTPAATISVISNGALLTPETVRSIVASEVDVFSCSFQSNTKHKYEVLMRGLDYDRTVAGLMDLLAAARGSRLRVCINMTATDENIDEIPEMAAVWEQRGARVVVNPLHNRGGYLKLEGRFSGGGVSTTAARCGLMNSRLFISSEGEVLACCHDLAGDTRIGNITSEPLIDILTRRLERVRKSELYAICRSCTDDSALVTVPLQVRGAELPVFA